MRVIIKQTNGISFWLYVIGVDINDEEKTCKLFVNDTIVDFDKVVTVTIDEYEHVLGEDNYDQ